MITVHSPSGSGATPRVDRPEGPRATSIGAEGGSGRPPGILVVDDDPEVRSLLAVVLGEQGFTVWLAEDGCQGLKEYGRHRDAIDLVLLDVRMPVLDGPQTLAALRQYEPELRYCFLTGDPGRYTEEELMDRGAGRILLKPFRLEELATTLRELAHPSTLPPASPAPAEPKATPGSAADVVAE